MSVDEDFDLSAAWLRADGAELAISIDVMAHKLEQALPARTHVDRRGKGLLGRDKHVNRVQVQLGQNCFELTVDGERVEGFRERKVGGIAIKREPLGIDEWISALASELRDEAQRSGEARAALESLLSV